MDNSDPVHDPFRPVKATPTVVRVAVPTPLPTCFDYLPGRAGSLHPGVRVRVPFGRGHSVGIVVATGVPSSVGAARLKSVEAALDERPVFDTPLLELLGWAADYYCHAPGEVMAAALPRLLRTGRPVDALETVWTLTEAGQRTVRNQRD